MSDPIKAALATAGAEIALKQRDDMEYREAAAIVLEAFFKALPARWWILDRYSLLDDIGFARQAWQNEPQVCPVCEGGGWVHYGLGRGDPHFKQCERCGNPEDFPCP